MGSSNTKMMYAADHHDTTQTNETRAHAHSTSYVVKPKEGPLPAQGYPQHVRSQSQTYSSYVHPAQGQDPRIADAIYAKQQQHYFQQQQQQYQQQHSQQTENAQSQSQQPQGEQGASPDTIMRRKLKKTPPRKFTFSLRDVEHCFRTSTPETSPIGRRSEIIIPPVRRASVGSIPSSSSQKAFSSLNNLHEAAMRDMQGRRVVC